MPTQPIFNEQGFEDALPPSDPVEELQLQYRMPTQPIFNEQGFEDALPPSDPVEELQLQYRMPTQPIFKSKASKMHYYLAILSGVWRFDLVQPVICWVEQRLGSL